MTSPRAAALSSERRRRQLPLGTIVGVAALISVVGIVSAVAWWMSTTPAAATPWSRVVTEDVHALAFAPESLDTVYVGHHGGVLLSTDAGRTWSSLPVRADAMVLAIAEGGRMYVAGHQVLLQTEDGGRSWVPVPADLPDLDIHAFAVDPADSARLWAYVAGRGLYESGDSGVSWTLISDATTPFLAAYRGSAGTELLGVEPTQGFARSTDGGRTWTAAGAPGAFPMTALATSPDGELVMVGTPDAVVRSEDAGRTWTRTPMPGTPLAIGVAEDGLAVGLALADGTVYRSMDGGRTWRGSDVH